MLLSVNIFQVRTTGAVDILTKQPIKGRKKGGGIRFGEMERDALLAHGTSFLLQDRLFNCSDRSVVGFEFAYFCVPSIIRLFDYLNLLLSEVKSCPLYIIIYTS